MDIAETKRDHSHEDEEGSSSEDDEERLYAWTKLTREELWDVIMNKDLIQEYRWMGRATKYNMGTLPFGMDKVGGKKGAKMWWCASIKKWTEYIFGLAPELRCGYSVVSNKYPCFGYYDMEFMKEINKNHDITRMLGTWFKHFAKVWQANFPEIPAPSPTDFIVLSASNNVKESKHVHGPLTCGWKNINHLRAFNHVLLESLQQAKASGDPDATECFVTVNNQKSLMPFIDSGVYFHNTCLRMYKCTKLGDYRPLLVDPNWQLPKIFEPLLNDQDALDRELFKYTAICAVPPSVPLLEFRNEALLAKLIPASEREKAKRAQKFAFFMFKFTKVSDKKHATHLELREKDSFLSIDDTKQLYVGLAKENQPYCTHEVIGERTILMIEFYWDSGILQPPEKQTAKKKDFWKCGKALPAELLAGIQSTVKYLIPTSSSSSKSISDPSSCYVFELNPSTFRLMWPSIHIDRANIEPTVQLLDSKLLYFASAIGASITFFDAYKHGAVLLPGAQNFNKKTKKLDFMVKFSGVFDENGEKFPTPLSKLDVLTRVSVRLPANS